MIRYLVVDTGAWLSNRRVLISPISIHGPNWVEGTLPVSITREQVKNSPDIDTHQPVSRQNETQYLGYYGYPNYWGGAGMWGEGVYPYAMVSGYVGEVADRAQQEQAEEDCLKAERARHRNDDPHLRSCKAVMVYHLDATDGHIGHVDGMLVDEETWAIRYLIVNTGHWWVGHKVLISPDWIMKINWSDQSMSAGVTRDDVKAAPHYEATSKLNQQQETELFDHYRRTSFLAGNVQQKSKTLRHQSRARSKSLWA